MIIDSHAHYCHKLYDGEFSYLDWDGTDFVVARGDRQKLLETMARRGICLSLEPATTLEKIPTQMEVVASHGGCLRLALGVHPKHCAHLTGEDAEKLRDLVLQTDMVAVGETGLDYSVEPEELDIPCQKRWFRYQIELAHQRQLPLILHSRDAAGDMLEILQENRALLHGGTAHCFAGDYSTAAAYADLGLAIGIGGKLLSAGEDLREAVRRMPLEALLLETDAPYIRPNIGHLPLTGKQRRKVRNSSLILPAVIEKIAELRQQPADVVEQAIYENTLRIFRLRQTADGKT